MKPRPKLRTRGAACILTLRSKRCLIAPLVNVIEALKADVVMHEVRRERSGVQAKTASGGARVNGRGCAVDGVTAGANGSGGNSGGGHEP